MRRALVVASLCALGCGPSTVLHVNITEAAGAPPPASLSLTVFDAHGRIIDGANLGDHPVLPGDVTVLINPGPIRALLTGRSDSGKNLYSLATASVVSGTEGQLPMQLQMGKPVDSDGDGVPDMIDNCPTVPNPDQASDSGSTMGDACRPTGGTGGGGGGGGGSGDMGVANNGGQDAFVPPAKCGNGTIDPGEDCDDGTSNSDDPLVAAAKCTTGCKARAGCGSMIGASAAVIDPSSGHCYVAWGGQFNFAAAQRECQRNGGDLASVDTQGEEDLLRGLAGMLDMYWIGVATPPGTPAWKNADGTVPPILPWAPGQPTTNGHCVAIAVDGWHVDNCGMQSNGAFPSNPANVHPYICESACGNGKVDPGEACDPPGPTCTKTCQALAACTESGGQSVAENGHCYFQTSTTVTYAQALTAGCPTGTHLATLAFPVETEAALKVAGNNDSWIAMSAMTTEAVFTWDVPGDIFDFTRYHAFGGNDPNQTPPACVAVTNNPPNNNGPPGWRDRDCASTTLYRSICERDK